MNETQNDFSDNKVLKYEYFVNEKLKTDLGIVVQQLDNIYSDIAEYLQIKDTIEKIIQINPKTNEIVKNNNLLRFKSKVDLGCNFYANAVVETDSKILLAIGFGFFLELTFEEALKFIDKKIGLLKKDADELKTKSSEIKANIRFVLEGLKEIQNIKFINNTQNEKKNII